MHLSDYLLIAGYFVALIAVTFIKNEKNQTESQFILAGRRLSLPAFVATLVSTWYGGILGVGEFGYQFGISQWIVLGLPFYIFAILFAFFLVKYIRESDAKTLPEAVGSVYGNGSKKWTVLFVLILTSPAPYIVMLSILFKLVLGWDAPFEYYAIAVTLFSLFYVWYGGFSAVVRTDILQMILMYLGFFVIVFFGFFKFDSISDFISQIPEQHLNPTGGHSVYYILVWFFIALWTFVDPGFHQRVSAAKNAKTAKYGILISVLFWFIFDFLTMTASLMGVVLLPDLETPAIVYPELAKLLLPAGFRGLFFVGLLATIMSTMDSFMLLSGQSLGRDGFKISTDPVIGTRIGLLITAVAAIALGIIYPDVIALWYGIGTVVIPGLLLTVLGTFIPYFRIPKRFNFWMMAAGFLISAFWLLLNTYINTGVEAFYPGLSASILIWWWGKQNAKFKA